MRLLVDWAIDGRAADAGVQLETESNVIRLGRHPDNVVLLPSLRTALFQAEVRVLADGRRCVKDVQAVSANG